MKAKPPAFPVELDATQRSLLGNIASKTELEKAQVLQLIISAGLHAVRENGLSFRLPLKLKVVEEQP
jgi:hypothetical protein